MISNEVMIRRGDFTIYILDLDQERAEEMGASLSESHYSPMIYSSVNSFKGAVQINPPHVVLFSFEGDLKDGQQIQKLFKILPETHFILISSDLDLLSAMEYLDKGAYDCLEHPFMGESQLVCAVDRAVERDFYFYQKEQLLQRVQALTLKTIKQ